MDKHNLNLESILREVPDEIKPVVGTLHYNNIPRAKLLISDLIRYVVRELRDPFYPELGLAMTEEKAQHIFAMLDTFLAAYGYYEQLGDPIERLVRAACEVSFSGENLVELEGEAERVWNSLEVQQASAAYMDAYQGGELTCFYCDKRIDIGGSDSSTEFGILWGCRDDWESFGNPDQYT